MVELYCKNCGGTLLPLGEDFCKCENCGSTYTQVTAKKQQELLNSFLDKQKQDNLNNLRRHLWQEATAKFIDSEKIVSICLNIKNIYPEDFLANFYEVVCGENAQAVIDFIDNINVKENYDVIEPIVNFLIKSLKSEYLLCVNNLIERAFKQTDLEKFNKLTTAFAKQAELVEDGVYNLDIKRDVFVAYSSADMQKVQEVVTALESEGLTCFVAMRNLQHGVGAVNNYQQALEKAINNCKIFLFISSKNSRNFKCDAIKHELPYLRDSEMAKLSQKFINVAYSKIDNRYKKPRVQLRLDDAKSMADILVNEVFAGLEYCYDIEGVLSRISEYLLSNNYVEEDETQKLRDQLEQQNKMLAEQLKEQEKRFKEQEERFKNQASSGYSIDEIVARAEEKRREQELKLARTKLRNVLINISDKKQKEEKIRREKAERRRILEAKRREEERKRLEEERRREEEKQRGLEVLKKREEAIAERQRKIAQEQLEKEIALRKAKRKKILISVLCMVFIVFLTLIIISIDIQIRGGCVLIKNENGYTVESIEESYRNKRKIIIPKTYKGKPITFIGTYAFSGCSSLTSVVIPDSVTSIGEFAFGYCSSLTSIELPNSVISIGDNAFSGCSSLTSIEIPDSVTSIGWKAFSSTAYYNDATNWEDGVLYIDKYLIEAKHNISGSYSIKEGTLCIGSSAFDGCESLTSVEIPAGVTSIGVTAFDGCSSLTSIEIPNSVTSIGYAAFRVCSSLTSIEIPNGVTSIGYSAFEDCSSLTSVVIPDSVTSIGERAFYKCTSLTSIEIPNSVTSIGEWAFFDCSSLTSIEIPNGVTSIGHSAFAYCSSLTSIEIPNSVTSIGDYAFNLCRNLTSIEIPDSVTSIGDKAFYSCNSLTSVVIGDSVISIGDEAFYGTAYYNNQSNWKDSVLYIGKYLIDAKTTIEGNYAIKEGTLCIANYAFSDCSSLTSIEVPNSVTMIGERAFSGCYRLVEVINKSSHITVTKGSSSNGYVGLYALAVYNANDEYQTKFSNDNGYIIYIDGSKKILVDYSGSETNLTLPNYITKIYQYAFYNCRSLTSIEIPDSVTSIGSSAFEGCSSLTSIKIPDGVTSINISAFEGCRSLTSIEIPDSVTSIGSYAFRYCSSLTSIKYKGTQDMWEAISKGYDWDLGTGNYTITYNYDG